MRLLNRKTLQLESFYDEPYPAYVVLSHRWCDTEMTIKDLQEGRAHLREGGHKKMWLTCAQAEVDEIDYIWIDTFCIDKESSAELSESINSMFAWYNKAKVCYAYMADVSHRRGGEMSDDFDKSEWFERGWTLQELIAPKEVVFYSNDWVKIGTRSSLANRLARITKVDKGILTGLIELRYVSIAKRMSWAADRKTTRKEDIAYCLAGLFDVNMATLYGEGSEKAFRRLQEEIMKDSDDESLFAWTNERKDQPELRGLLAASPADFRNSGRYIPDYAASVRVPASTTGRGLCVTLGMRRLKDDIWVGALQCPVPPEYTQMLAVYLKLLDEPGQQYARIKADTLCKIPQRGTSQTICVRQKPLIPGFDDIYLHHAFQLRRINIRRQDEADTHDLSSEGYALVRTEKNPLCGVVEPLPTSAQQGVPPVTFEMPRANARLAGLLVFSRPDDTEAVVLLGSDPGIGPGVHVFSGSKPAESRSLLSRLSLASPGWADIPREVGLEGPEGFLSLHASGTVFDLDQDRIQVNIEPKHHAGIRYYMIDITIKLPKVMSLEDVVPVAGVNTHKIKLINPFRSHKKSVTEGIA